MQITDNFRISKSHWYAALPRKVQYQLVKRAIQFGLIHRYGKLCVEVTRAGTGKKERVYGYNILTDIGLKHLGDILTGTETTDLDIAYIEPGSGTTTPAIGDSDTETPLTTADRLAVTSQTRATTSPFEIVVETFVNSTKYTRPQTINELVIFFGPDESGDIFARGVLSSGIVMNAGDTATLTYGFVWR